MELVKEEGKDCGKTSKTFREYSIYSNIILEEAHHHEPSAFGSLLYL